MTGARRTPLPQPVRLLRLGLFALICAAACLVLASAAVSAKYVRAITRPGCQDDAQTSADYGLGAFDTVSFTTADGIPLSGLHLASGNGATIVLMGGIASARSAMLAEAAMLVRHNYGVLLFDWRGCDAIGSSPHTLGYRETWDAIAAVQYLLDETSVEHVGVLGFSVGGAAALRAAARHPGIGAVVAMGSYHDLQDEISGQVDVYPVISRILTQQIVWLFEHETGVRLADENSPVELVAQISPRPVMLIYGELEESQQPSSGSILYEAAREPKELWIVPAVGHGGYYQAQPVEFERRVTSFFDSSLLH